MYSVRKRILSSTLIAMMMVGMVFQAAAEEGQTSLDEAATEAVVIMDSEPSSFNTELEAPAAQEPEAPAAQEPEALEPQADATAEPAATGEPESTLEPADEASLVEIPDEQVPLAGGQDPIVSVRANCDISSLAIGDNLVLTCELSGFGGFEYTIQWQARVNGEWRDLAGEHSESLDIKITNENADWAYRAAVDAQPV